MAEFKVNIGDPKTGKTVKKVFSDEQAQPFLKKRIGDKISGDEIGFAGYEFEISGGSDYCGFPMRRDVRGISRKRILIVSGIGIRKNKKSRKGRKTRKTVAGNTIYSRTAQINLKILKYGSKPLAEKKEEAPAEKPAEGEKKEDKKKDKPTEKPKEEPKKEEPKKEEKPKKETKEAKKAPEPAAAKPQKPAEKKE